MSNPQDNPFNTGDFPTGVFYPYLCGITAISSSGDTSTVTTSIPHMFVVGNQVTFQIPREWGMRQLDQLKGYVVRVPDDMNIVVNINTTYFDAFVVPTTSPLIVINPSQVLPIGDQNTGQLSPGGIPPFPNCPPGSFTVTLLPA